MLKSILVPTASTNSQEATRSVSTGSSASQTGVAESVMIFRERIVQNFDRSVDTEPSFIALSAMPHKLN